MADKNEQHRYVSIYLRDHLASAIAGIELAHRLHKGQGESVFASETEHILEEIDEDREVLEGVMEHLDIEPSEFKNTAAWLGEKLGRLKLNGRLVSRSPLSSVYELEGLEMGVTGKRALWESLQSSALGRELEKFDFERLIERADEQLNRLRELHRRAAEEAFAERVPAAETSPERP